MRDAQVNKTMATGSPRLRVREIAWPVAVAMAAIVAALMVARPSAAATNATVRAPLEIAGALPTARLQGSGTLRFFGLAIYEARLWTAPDFAPERYDAHTFALELRYARKLNGAAIAERSITEMRRVGTFDQTQAKAWLEQLTQAFPDVKPGDRLTGVRGPGGVTGFYSNGQPTSSIADPEFGRLFFGIWLSNNTSEPALRRELIGQTW